MLSELIGSIPAGNPKHPIALYRLIDAVNTRLIAARDRFNATDSVQRTSGVDLLRWMLLNFDLEAARSYTDNTRMFIELVESYRNKFRIAFDPVYSRNLSSGKFVKGPNNRSVTEIILDSTRKNVVDLPLEGNWSTWKNIRAVRLLFHDSSELAIDCLPSYVTFAKKTPSFAVLSIDISVLLMKWALYNLQYEGDKSADKFLHMEYERFYEDMGTTWFVNLITNIITHPELSSDEIADEQYVPSYVTNDALLIQGIDSLKAITNLIPSRAIRLQDILDTRLNPKWPSIRGYAEQLQEDVYVQDDRRYIWMNMIRFLPLMRIMGAVFKQDPGNPAYGQVMRRMYNWYVKNLKFANIPTMQWSQVIKSYIEAVSGEFEKVFAGQLQTDKGEPIQASDESLAE